MGGTPSHDATRPTPRGAPRYPARMPVDYSGQDLRGRDFSRQDLKWANLEDANLSGADLTDADLTGAFRRPGINRADLAGVKGLDSIIGLVELGTPEVEGSVTVRTPLTGTHESPGYRDGPGVASDRLLWHRRHPVGAAMPPLTTARVNTRGYRRGGTCFRYPNQPPPDALPDVPASSTNPHRPRGYGNRSRGSVGNAHQVTGPATSGAA